MRDELPPLDPLDGIEWPEPKVTLRPATLPKPGRVHPRPRMGMRKEPIAIFAIIAALIVGFLSRYNITWIDSASVETLLQVVAVLFTAWMGRRKVMPLEVINEAGLTSDDIKERAASPSFTPVKET